MAGRALRRSRRCRQVERLWAWLQNFRRVVVRYEVYPENFRAVVQLGCALLRLAAL
jgi:transposase